MSEVPLINRREVQAEGQREIREERDHRRERERAIVTWEKAVSCTRSRIFEQRTNTKHFFFFAKQIFNTRGRTGNHR